MNSIRKSVAFSLLSSNGVFFVQFVGTLIIARLITPSEFGIFSVASVVVALAQIFRDLGTSAYIVQTKELDAELLRSASGIAILSATTIGISIWLLSDPIARFYGEPSVAQVMQILALNFLLTPFGSVTMACLRREMRFGSIAVINVTSSAAGLVTSVILAWQGFGAIGLAWGPVAGVIVNILFALYLRPSYMPWGISLSRWRELLGFGSLTTSAAMIGYLNMASADLLLGKLAGMEAVGFFNRAATLSRFFFNLIMQGLSPVILPAFSRLRHKDGDLRQPVIDIAVRLTAVAWPAFAVIAVLAEPLVIVLFGDQWRLSAPLVPFMCASAAISAVYSSCGALHTARGKPGLNVVIESINLPIKAIAIIVTVPFGLIYVAAVWPLLALVGAITHHWFLAREVRLSVAMLYRPLLFNFFLAVLCATVAIGTSVGFKYVVLYPKPIMLAAVSLCSVALVWLAFIYMTHHPLRSELHRFTLGAVAVFRRNKHP